MRIYLTILCLVLSLYGVDLWGQSTKISLHLQNAPLKRLIQEIERQSDYYFIYQDDIFDEDQRININVKNASLDFILKELENQTSVKAEVVEHQVILTKIEEKGLTPTPDKKKISGKVDNESGQPLIGASVTIKGGMIGTLTNEQGFYEIEVPHNKDTLVFSYVGKITQELTTKNHTELNVVLKPEIIRIDEVVSLGYGTIKKTENTGSIATLKAKAFNEFPVTTIEQGLKGQLTGVQITPTSGQPGAGMSVRIRGVSSLAGGNEPLYIIDGIPTFNSDVRELNGLSWLNPDDISWVEVLKDAIATSIYGSRAANGVILIKTKNGIPGKPQITYDSYFAIQHIRKKMPLMNGEEYINYATEYYSNAQNISEEQRQQNLNALNTFGNANTDWQDEVFRPAFQQEHNLSFSGGNFDNSYYLSFNYANQNGIVKNSDFTHYGFRMNLNNNLTKWLDISSRTSFSKVTQNGFLAGDGTNTRNNEKSGIGATILVPSTVGVYDNNGDFSSVDVYPFSFEDLDNPVAMLQALDKNTMYYFIGGLDMNANFLPGISNTLRLGIEYSNKTFDYYLPKALLELGAQTAELGETKKFGGIFEDFLTIRKTCFEKLVFETIFGFSAQQDNYQSISLAGAVFPSDDLQNSAIQAAGSISTPETSKITTTLASFFSRVHLGYLNKYQLSLSIRYDGSSVFSESDKWATFPAVAFAWRLSEEEFLRNTIISDFKLRASWGQSGNQAIQPYQSLYVGEIVNTGQGAGTGINVGLAPNLPNKNLTWETTEQYNLGLDIGMYKERLRFVFDYYVRNTKDLLANVTLPGSAGYSYYVDNVGAVQNKGFELSFGSDLIKNKDWLFSLDCNFSKNRNIVKATKNNQDIILTRTDDATRTQAIVRVGEPLFSFYMPRFLGIDNTGKPTYEDLNNDDVIDENDSQIAGSPLPDFFYGFNTKLNYRKISLSMNWQGVYGAKLNDVPMMMLTEPEPTANRIKNIRDYYPRVSDDYIAWDSDRFIEDASYLRLKNIKLAYKMSDISGLIEELTVYISGQNMLTFTKYSGYDPEVNSFSNDNKLQGVDYAAFPSAKTVTLGVNLKF